jgi:membrane fusion protein, multidrug efflux system
MVLLLVAATGIGGYWYLHQAADVATAPLPPADEGPVVAVQTAPLRRERMEETVTAYGTVVTALGKTQVVSEPFETRVRQIFVTAGEAIEAGRPLVEIEPSRDTLLKLDQARSELQAAEEAAQLANDSFTLKLATKQDVNVAEQRLHDAQAALQSMTERGLTEPRVIDAGTSGVVMRIGAQPGQIVAPGGPLVEIVGQHEINILLGIEDEDVGHLHVGQTVRIVPVPEVEGNAVAGKIQLITQQVNPQTRLIDVYVAPDSATQLMLNEYVRGEIVISAEDSLVAPRAAVLPVEDHHVLYTVEHDRAVKHTVAVGIESNELVQILGGDLREGQVVVVSGNSELSDGMAVRSEPVP